MKRHLAGATLTVLLAALAGCASKKPQAAGVPPFTTTGSIAYGTFAKESEAVLTPRGELTGLYVAGDTVYGYTRGNEVYALSRGLDIRFVQVVARPLDTVRPPVAVGDEVVFPSDIAMHIYNKQGTRVRTVALPNPLSSDVRVDQRGLLLGGTVSPTGGRVTVFDPRREVRPVVMDTMIGNVLAAPTGLQGIVYAANDRGAIFAVGEESRSAWALEENMGFQTGRAVTAPLIVDDFALYVASNDSKLYALDRTNGRIKWRFMAQVPLTSEPHVTRDRVYQVVPGRGVVAIDKVEGKIYREPLWTTPGVTKVLGSDDKYLYGAQGTDRVVAIGLTDGKVKFDLKGDFDFVTAGPDNTIYAGTTRGTIVSFKRAPYTGENVATAR